jgi:hypothetical protein
LDTSNNAYTDTKIVMQSPDTPASSVLKVNVSTGFTTTIRVKAFTMNKDAYVQRKIRVCGEEVLTLVDSTSKTHVYGQVLGSRSSMSDSTRYVTYSQSTFATWFSNSANSAPCDIVDYQIVDEIGGTSNVPSTNNVKMTGSMGSYELKIDKSYATEKIVFKLKAITRGLVTVDQELNFVICPATGASNVIPPQNEMNAHIDTLTSGSNANAYFGEWIIQDLAGY